MSQNSSSHHHLHQEDGLTQLPLFLKLSLCMVTREKGRSGGRSPSLTKTMKSHMKSRVAYQYHSYEKNMAHMLKTVGQKLLSTEI